MRLVYSIVLALSTASAGLLAAQPSAIDVALEREAWGEAVRLLDSALAVSPTDAARLAQRARAKRELGQLDAALDDANRAIALDSTRAASYAGRAATHLRRDEPAAALRDVRSARRLGLSHPELDLMQGIALVDSDSGAAALPFLGRYVAAVPGQPAAWYYRARAAGMAGDDANAERFATEAITRRMPGAAAYRVRALARARRGDLSGACADAKEAGTRGDAETAARGAGFCP
jgi:predicted Zn-dependent protease